MPPPYQAMVPLWNKRSGTQELGLVNFMIFPEILEKVIPLGGEAE